MCEEVVASSDASKTHYFLVDPESLRGDGGGDATSVEKAVVLCAEFGSACEVRLDGARISGDGGLKGTGDV